MKQVGSMLHDPAIVQIAVKGETADTVDQYIAEVPHTLKPALLTALLRERGHERVIVFARTRRRADTCCRKLKRAGFSAEAIHSDRSQNQRQKALDRFAAGETDILVATDVLARGIDVNEVTYVVNYDLPTQPEDYVHRIGRTGRAGSRGFAVSFVSPENAAELKAIEKFVKKRIPKIEVAGFDLEEAAAEAAARATRAAAKKDPDIAEAARELAKKQRRKAQKKAENDGKEDRGRKTAGKPSRAKKPHEKSARADARKGERRSSQGGGKAHSQKAHHSGSSRAGSAPQQKRPSRASRPANDMRPGRAHRAAMAQRRKSAR